MTKKIDLRRITNEIVSIRLVMFCKWHGIKTVHTLKKVTPETYLHYYLKAKAGTRIRLGKRAFEEIQKL
jgi:hypothetical protein